MQKINKKGVSGIVSVIFFILASLASLAIIGNAIIGFTDASLSPALCTSITINPKLSINNACLDPENNIIQLSLTRDLTDNNILRNFDVNIVFEKFSESWTCDLSCSEECLILSPGETKTYLIPYTTIENPQEVIISLRGCAIEPKKILPC